MPHSRSSTTAGSPESERFGVLWGEFEFSLENHTLLVNSAHTSQGSLHGGFHVPRCGGQLFGPPQRGFPIRPYSEVEPKRSLKALSPELATEVIGGEFPGTLEEATNDGTSSCGLSTNQPDVWYQLSVGFRGTLRVNTCGTREATGVDTVVSLHSGAPGTTGNEITGGSLRL